MIRLFAAAAAAALVAACASYPERAVVQGGELGGLTFSDAPVGAVVFVNGAEMGPAAAFDGVAGVLELDRGRYHVEVRLGGQALVSRQIYLGDAIADIDVR
ncbi:MAG: hypothetical protein ACOC0V_05430 [Oceanicaulis sp.]